MKLQRLIYYCRQRFTMFLAATLIAILTTSLSFGKEFTTDEVDNLFKQLERHGKKILDDYKNANQQNQAAQHIQQYLTVTVLSEQEALESKNWGQNVPDWLENDKTRLHVIFNEKISQGVLPIDPKKPLHGEVKFLHLGEINKMLYAFTSKQKNQNPYVFLYSFYIPCANVKGVEYSCSQELGEHQLLNSNKFQMIVGWTELFPGTDVQSSKFFMGIAGIQQFEKKKNNVFEKLPIGAMAQPSSHIFQTLYFTCLNAMDYDGSCCVINCNRNGQTEQEKRAQILAYYINIMFATCTRQSNWVGSLTQLRMVILSNCVEQYINENTGSSCPKFSQRGTKKILHFCAIYSQAHATHIGTPADRNNPYSHNWNQGPNAWSAIYDGFNANPATRPEMHCFMSGASMKSICTKMGQDYKDLPDFLKSKAQNVGKKP